MPTMVEEKAAPRLTMDDVGQAPNRTPKRLREKPHPMIVTEQDDVGPADELQPEDTTTQVTLVNDETLIPSKNCDIQLRVSRRSTQSKGTAESKLSKRHFGIRWPKTKETGPGIHWYTPTMMVMLGLAGLFGALGHHLYNSRLDGLPVGSDSQWPQRWGVAMAYFVKMTLVGAVQMAVKQRAWVSI